MGISRFQIILREYLGRLIMGLLLANLLLNHSGVFAASMGDRTETAAEKLDQRSSYDNESFLAIKSKFNESLNSGRLPEMGKLIRGAAEEQKVWMFETLTRHIGSHPDAEIRMICIGAIRNFPEKGRDVVTRSLRADLDREVRSIAAYVLSSIGTEQETNALFEAIKEDKGAIGHGRDIAEAAIGSLGAIAGDRAGEILTEIWKSEELSRGCREVTLNALGASGDPSAVGILEEVLRGKEESLRDNAVYGLNSLADRKRGQPEVVQKIVRLLRQHLRDRNPRVRENVVRGLGTTGVAEDIILLEGLLQDGYSIKVSYTEQGELKTKTVYPIREAANEAVGRIKKRLPRKETPSADGSSVQQETPAITGANELAQSGSPKVVRPSIAVYALIVVGAGVVMVGLAVILKRKGSARRK